MKLKTLHIDQIKLKNSLLLAPMVDITDLPYRLICRKHGASLCYTEMIYIDALAHKNNKTLKLIETNKKDSPVGIQVTGENLESYKKSLPYLKKFDLVDINCGCPSEKLIKSKAGSFLLNNPEKIVEIIKFLKSQNLIVTAKIRLGFKNNNALEVAKAIEEAGADALTVHGRLASQGYGTKADWNEIKKIKKALKIPVIANGDVFSGKDAEELLEICDGVMIARGAIGDPLIFSRILEYLKTGKESLFNLKENLKALEEYLVLCKTYSTDITRVKHLAIKFIKNIKGASTIRNQIMQLKTIDEIESFVKNLKIQ